MTATVYHTRFLPWIWKHWHLCSYRFIVQLCSTNIHRYTVMNHIEPNKRVKRVCVCVCQGQPCTSVGPKDNVGGPAYQLPYPIITLMHFMWTSSHMMGHSSFTANLIHSHLHWNSQSKTDWLHLLYCYFVFVWMLSLLLANGINCVCPYRLYTKRWLQICSIKTPTTWCSWKIKYSTKDFSLILYFFFTVLSIHQDNNSAIYI